MNMPIQLREEGGKVPDGFSLSLCRSQRIHVFYRQTLASGMVQILHMAIPIKNPFDLAYWSCSDEVFDPTDVDERDARGVPGKKGSL